MAVTAAATATLAPVQASADHDDGPVVIARGLDNPRGLALGWHGSVLVAESGEGGDDGCFPPVFPPGPMCLGRSGAVTMITGKNRHRRIVTGLPSLANESDGGFALGPSDVSVRGRRLYVAIGGPGGFLDRSVFGHSYARRLGTVQQVSRWGLRTVADVAAHEDAVNPHPKLKQTNVQSVLVRRGHVYVVDAAGNTVYEVGRRGRLELLAAFPDRSNGVVTFEAVPSSLTIGPDGALYLSDVTGAPFPAGGANVWRWDGDSFEVFATGFTSAIDLAFGSDGSLYVVETFPGRVVRVAPDGSRSIVASGLSFPGGIVVKSDHTLYVSNNGTSADAGEVLRVKLDD